MNGTLLLSAVAVDTTGAAFHVVGPCAVFCEGSFGGGTLSIQVSRDGTTWLEINSLTAKAVFNDSLVGPHSIRAVLTGSSTPSVTVAVL